ncbi:MAG: glycosyltransferase family 4 protein [Actinomycetia bacterium]|nr:glycosyltransferase family 4 protein [Actinomycetes bacterium]MCP4959690.1 glycosyltransferase family 4 protein [Actinomycetes bacterium]
MVRHLLVTNDYPPKVGGIQAYLWELWRRLPAEEVTVLTTPYKGSADFDAEQAYRIDRVREPVLLPRPGLARKIDALADEVGAELVLIDPALPLGWVGPYLRHPYAVVLHGAEVTVPGRLPVSRHALRRVLNGARFVVGAGQYSIDEAERAAGTVLPSIQIPPGVDTQRFVPLDDDRRAEARRRFGVAVDAKLVVGISRLVPRKGFDVLIDAAARVAKTHPELQVLIGGGGRDRARLEKRAEAIGAPVRFLGRFDEDDKPLIYGMADLSAMLCRVRWRGLEQEGFGIVFLEAAAAGVPQIAGNSGGAAEAVIDGVTGLVIDRPKSVDDVAGALDRMLGDPQQCRQMGVEARRRAVDGFSYDLLAARLYDGLEAGMRGEIGV